MIKKDRTINYTKQQAWSRFLTIAVVLYTASYLFGCLIGGEFTHPFGWLVEEATTIDRLVYASFALVSGYLIWCYVTEDKNDYTTWRFGGRKEEETEDRGGGAQW